VADQWRAVVRDGYDAVAASYLADRTVDGADMTALAELTEKLAPDARVLDAGSGAGIPVTRALLTAGVRVVGLDFSRQQLELARDLVPASIPVQGDLAGLPFADASFDALVSYYAIIHVPRAEHHAVFAEAHRVLRPGGWTLLCVGAADLSADHDPDSWLGAPMYWSHFDGSTNLDLPDPMGHQGHLFVLARRSSH
jgi:ubiquinone/menaquinone biosynthesis C-methylase UbiE